MPTVNEILAAGHKLLRVVDDAIVETYTDDYNSGTEDVYVVEVFEAQVTTSDGTTTKYHTVEDATTYASAQAGSTLTLLRDCAVEGYYGIAGEESNTNKKDFTLDLNGYTLEGKVYAICWYGSTLTITDSSAAGTGTIKGKVSAKLQATLKIRGGNFQRGAEVAGSSTLEIYGGKFTDENAVKVIYKDANLAIYGGTIQGSNCDILFSCATGEYTGTTTLQGGTFPGGLQIGKGNDHEGSVPTVNEILAEGYGFLNEDGILISVADDVTTTGTETVTVVKHSDCEASVTVGETTTTYLDIDKALAAANEAVAAGTYTHEQIILKVLKDAAFGDESKDSSHSTVRLNGFTLDLNGCTLKPHESYNRSFSTKEGYTTNIRDSSTAQTGKLVHVQDAYGVNYGATVNFYGGTVALTEFAGGRAFNVYGTLNVFGGTITYTVAAFDGMTGTIGAVNVYGGIFTCGKDDFWADGGTVTLYGGTFTKGIKTTGYDGINVETFLAPGCVFLDESGNVVTGDALATTTVTVKGPYAASVTTTDGSVTLYDSVKAALNAANKSADSTVKLLMNADYSYTQLNGTLSIDLNGYTLNMGNDALDILTTYQNANCHVTIFDGSEAQTGTVSASGEYLLRVSGGNGAVVKLTIRGGKFVCNGGITYKTAIRVMGTADMEIYGGSFQGKETDIYSTTSGSIDIFGGTFPGGLQLAMDEEASNEKNVNDLLAQDYAYFAEDGTAVIPADDALTTGTQTVTVKKQAALNITMDKEVYLIDDENVAVTFTLGQKKLTGNLYVVVDGKTIGVHTLRSNDPLVTGKTMYFDYILTGPGEHTLAISFIPFDSNIAKGVSNTVTFTVQKVPNENLSKHLSAAQSTFAYDGTAKALDLLSKYTEGNKFYLAPENFTLTYWQGGTQVENPTDVGTYTVKITMAETDYYQAADNYEIGTLTIEQGELTLEMLKYSVWESGEYNGSPYKALATMKSHITAYGELKVEYLKEGQTERTTEHPVEPGTYTVYVSVTGGDNVKASEVTLGSFTIKKAAAVRRMHLEINGEAWEYDRDTGAYHASYDDQTVLSLTLYNNYSAAAVPTGKVQLCARKALESGGYGGTTIIVSAALDENGVARLQFQLDPGKYLLELHYLGDERYNENTASVADGMHFVITPTVVTLTPSGLEQTYDSTQKTISFTNSTRKLGMEDFTVTYYQVNENMGTISKVNRAVAIGRYLYVVELKEEHRGNYYFANPITIDGDTLPDGTFDNAGFMDIVAKLPEAQEPIYFTEGAVTVYLVDGTYSGNTLVNPNNTVPTYTSSNESVAEVAADGTVTLKRTGTVTIFATSEKEGTTPVRASYTLTIEKKDATITVNGLTTTYGAPFTLTADMLTVTGCELTDLDLTGLSYSGYTVGQGVGTYYITPAGITSEAYDLTFVAGTLTVQPRAIDAATIAVTAAGKVYDGTTATELTATLPEGAVLSGDKVTVTAEGAYTAAIAGTAEATVTALTLEGKDSGNYVLTGTAPTTALGEIQKATVTFTTESRTFTYDGTAKALDIVAKTNNGLTAEYTVQYNAEPVLPGEYTVTVTLTDTVNYTADVTGLEGKTLTITAAKQQSFTVSGLEDGIRYGDVLTLTAENAEGEVNFQILEGTAATIEGSTITAVCTGKIVILATSVKEGYEDKTVKVTVTVGKRLITASLESITDRQYDGTTEVTATVALVGVINNDTVSVTNVAEVQTPDAGKNKSVTITLGDLTGEDAELYQLTTETLRGKVNITAREIDADKVTITVAGKIYDGTTTANLTATLPEGAVLEGDQVTITAEGAYTSANAGTTTANVTVLTLGGNDARNYVLTGTAPTTAEGEITKATATFTAASKTVSYDGYEKVLDINVKTNNGLTADYTVTYSTADGSAPVLPGTYTVTVTLTDTVNYTADLAGLEGKTLTITAAKQQSFTVSGLEDGIRYGDVLTLTAENAEGTVTFTITEGTAATVTPSGKLTAVGTGKIVILATSVKEGFEDKTVKVTVTVGKRQITAEVDTITDRPYDGSTVVNATVKLVGIINNDDVTAAGIIAEMMTPGAGESKTVSITISGLSGNTADLYTLSNTTLRGTVNITPKTVEAITFTVADKYYDGTTDAEIVNVTLTGILGSDQVFATAKAEFTDANAGENKTVTLADVILTGADARNYQIADTTTVTVNNPTIHRTLVSVFCPESTTYTYDGTAKTVYMNVMANGTAFNGYTVSYNQNGEPIEGQPIDAGTYDVVVTLNDSVNYELAPYAAKLVIELATQDDLEIHGIPDRVYYGDSFAVTVPGTEGTVTWEITGAALDNGSVTANDVGIITLKATVKLANYKDQIITRTVTAYPRVLTATATATNRTYNGKNDVEVTITLSNVAFNDAVTATAQAQMATSDAGTDKLVYVSGITLSDSVHYTLEVATLQTTVDIAPIVIESITATAQDKVYDGTDEAQVTITGSGNVLSGDEITITGTGRFASANAGKHTVTVTPKTITGPKAQNYVLADGLTGTAQAEIIPATVLFEVGTATFFYDGKVKTVEITAKLGSKAFTDFTVSYDPAEAVNAGTYTVTVTLSDSLNYVGAPAPFTMEILPADQNQLIISGMPGVVDYGRVFTLTTNAHENATVTWTTSDETIATVDANGKVTIVDVDREVTITTTSSMANYNDATATVTFTPVAKQVTFQLSGLVSAYDGTVQGVTVTPSVEGLTDYSVTYTDEQGRVVEPINAGIYEVEVTTTGNKYTGYTVGTFTIQKGTLAGILTMEDWTYGDEPNTPEYTISVEGLRPEYSYSGTGLKDGKPYGAGQYTVYATFSDRNHEPLTLSADFEINKAMLTVTAVDATRTYGETNPDFQTVITGFVYGETIGDLLVEPTAATVATVSSDVGEYAITVSGGRSENYAFTYVPGTLTIAAAEGVLTITGSSHEVTIGQELYLQANLNGFRPNVIWSSSDETVAVIDENGKVTIVGAGVATITAELNEKNYVAEDATFRLETTQKVISLLPKTTVFTYNGTVQSVEFAETQGFVPVVGENVQVTYTMTTDSQTVELRNAGTYVAVYEITDPAYAGSGTFTVYMNKATRTLRPADLEKTRGEANPAFTIDPNGLLGEDVTDESYIARVNAMFVFTCEADEDALEGTYTITMALAEGHSLTEDSNYDFVIDSEPGTLIIRSITGSEHCPSAHFTDLDPNEWYHDAIDFVVENGLMKGMSETIFAPNGNLTRAQMVTILYRMSGEPSVEGLENPFADVPNDEWFAEAIIWAYHAGVVKGTSATTFAPNVHITREQLATILYRYSGADAVEEDHLNRFTDADTVSIWAEEAMNWAVASGLITGMSKNTLAPTGTATRAQIATILMRYCEE